ncbi:hypothetical protein LEMLEM_LOCUS15088, partial [Lemmus lemmus]
DFLTHASGTSTVVDSIFQREEFTSVSVQMLKANDLRGAAS